MLEIGTKIIDLEEGLWGLIWKATFNPRGYRYQIRWSDGSVTRGIHDAILDDLESGYLIID